MTDAPMSSVVRQDACAGSGQAAPGATGLIALSATPVFALMALWTAWSSGPPDMLCMAHAPPLTGMTAMYLLMSVFHAAPWLRLIAPATRS
jgi:hypothetical protein